MKQSKMTCLCRPPQMFLIWSAFVLIGACATVPDAEEWIKVGQTTKVEVVGRYGQPDFVMASGEGETATYRPRDPRSFAPRMEIPTMQAGCLGSVTTKMETIPVWGPDRRTAVCREDRSMSCAFVTMPKASYRNSSGSVSVTIFIPNRGLKYSAAPQAPDGYADRDRRDLQVLIPSLLPFSPVPPVSRVTEYSLGM